MSQSDQCRFRSQHREVRFKEEGYTFRGARQGYSTNHKHNKQNYQTGNKYLVEFLNSAGYPEDNYPRSNQHGYALPDNRHISGNKGAEFPGIITGAEQLSIEGNHSVIQCPAGNDNIKRENQKRRQYLQNSSSLPAFTASGPDKRSRCASAPAASDGKLSQQHRQADQHQTDNEEQEERRTAIFPGNIREFPHIPQTHRAADGCQDKAAGRKTLLLLREQALFTFNLIHESTPHFLF